MNATGLTAGAAAFVVCLALTPIVKRLCDRWQLLDFPGPLKIHEHPIPRLGGVALVLAIVSAASFAGWHFALQAWPFFAALALVWTTALADDFRGLSFLYRLAAQVAAGAVLWLGGWRLPAVERMQFPGHDILGLAAVCLFVALFVNAFNFLDGADGLAAGVSGIIAAAYIAVPGAAGNPFAATAAWSILGACAGFLIFNFPPARLFLGDSGSYALGFGVAFLGLDYWGSSSSAGAACFFPFLVAGFPLLDAALAIIRRLNDRGSPFRGDRGHIYDLFLARGWPPRRVALLCYAITFALAMVGWLAMRGNGACFAVVSAVSLSALLWVAIDLGALRRTPVRRGEVQRRSTDKNRASSLA